MDNDHEGEDSIAVGSTGTLLSLMGKEMEILQARKSCSVAQYHKNKRSPSAKWDHNTKSTYGSSNVFGSPLPSFTSPPPPPPPPPPSIVSSLWSDLKGLLRSPTSVYHSPLLFHHNFLFWKEDSDEHITAPDPPLALSCSFSPSQSPASPRIFSPSPILHSYPKEKPACPTQTPSRAKHPKQKAAATDAAAAYFNQKSLKDERLYSKDSSGAGAADHNYSNRKSPLHIYPTERSAAEAAPARPYPDWKIPMKDHSVAREAEAYPNQVSPRQTYTNSDERIRRENRPNRRSLTEAGAAAADPHLNSPTYSKRKVVQDGLFAVMRKGKSNDADHGRTGKLQEEARGSRRSGKICSCKKQEDRMICVQYEYCVQSKREERGCVKEEEFSRLKKREERVCMKEEYACMKKREERDSMLQMQQSRGPSHGRPSFKSSRSFGSRSLPPVSVVDLKCCHSSPLERSARRLSFTRLASFS